MYVNESAINVTLTVVRGKGTFGNVSVFYYAQSLGDGARPGADFILKPQVRKRRYFVEWILN